MIDIRVGKMLRGLAILIVIASHYAGWMFVDPIHVRAHDLVSSLGPFGVDVFFLLSGYGLVKSASKNAGGVNWEFAFKRFMATYFPYVLIIGVINIIQNDWAGADGKFIFRFFTAYSYWYMNILFIMYIMFMIVWKYGKNTVIKTLIISVLVVILTMCLFKLGRSDFWELSNSAFLIGIYTAVIEDSHHDLLKNRSIRLGILIVGTIGSIVAYMGMISLKHPEYMGIYETLRKFGGVVSENVPSWFAWELIVNIFFTLIILGIALLVPRYKGGILVKLGECSLFVYLIHAALFWALVFKFEDSSYAVAASITGLITLVVSLLIGTIYNRLSYMIIRRITDNER